MPFAFMPRTMALWTSIAALGIAACTNDRQASDQPADTSRIAPPIRVSAKLLRDALDSLPQPPAGADTTHGNPVHGRALYATYCVECHGMQGHGDGRLAAGYHPRPADLHQVQIVGREDSVMALIKAGSPAHHTMPDWGAVFTDRRVRDLTAYLKILQQH